MRRSKGTPPTDVEPHAVHHPADRVGPTILDLRSAPPQETRHLTDGHEAPAAPDMPGKLARGREPARLAVREPEQSDSTLRVPVADGPRALMDALRALDNGGLAPTTLVVREPSLDDVFLTLTGRRAESAEPAPETTRGAA